MRAYRGRRIGFYSYSYRDVINTYGMSRARYGSINSYRDPFVDMQTPNGPFDHGFFFDSGMSPRGGNAPTCISGRELGRLKLALGMRGMFRL